MSTDVVQLLKECRQDIEREFRKEYRELKTSMDFFNKSFEEMKAALKVAEAENAEIKAQNLALTAECSALRSQVLENEHKIVQLEQYSRCKNIEIKGVPSIEGESLPALLHKVGSVLGEPIVETDIDACHRVPTKDDTVSNIVVQFRSRSKRDIVLEKARKTRVSTTDLDFTHPSPVFVNEHLCPDLKRLLGMTVSKKKEKGWRYVWTKGGKIFARKTESSRTLKVTRVSDLEKIE